MIFTDTAMVCSLARWIIYGLFEDGNFTTSAPGQPPKRRFPSLNNVNKPANEYPFNLADSIDLKLGVLKRV